MNREDRKIRRLIIFTLSPQETHDLGKVLGELLGESSSRGQLVALSGNLGAGKTCLVQGILRGLKVQDRYLTSPTFTLINEYGGTVPVYHFDVYRLASPQELEELGYEEYFFGQGVTLVEWAEKIEDLLPEDHLTVVLEYLGTDSRRLLFIARGEDSEKLLGRFRHRLFSRKYKGQHRDTEAQRNTEKSTGDE
ncbi:MAG: tRNA (adenosine(37)-N6)-threonylcarbamoyltransferase complex ATPase subunit type 1 TsaE [bacterium]